MGPDPSTLQKLNRIISRMRELIKVRIARKAIADNASNFMMVDNSTSEVEKLRKTKRLFYSGVVLGGSVTYTALEYRIFCPFCLSTHYKDSDPCPRQPAAPRVLRVTTISVKTNPFS